MRRIVLFCLLVLFCRLSFSDSPTEEQAESLAEAGSRSVIRQATEARRRLEDVALDFAVRQSVKRTEKTIQAGKGKRRRAAIATQTERHVTRQFAIAALDEGRGDWHTVLLDVAYPLPAAADFSFRVLSGGYLVKHLSGRGITKLNFEVHLLPDWNGSPVQAFEEGVQYR